MLVFLLIMHDMTVHYTIFVVVSGVINLLKKKNKKKKKKYIYIYI